MSPKPVQDQVIKLCDQLGVTVVDTDFVDVHPLPSKPGRAKRVIARFKDRKLAHKVIGSRKNSKQMDPTNKAKLAADSTKGFGIQPNITPRRAALLGQAKQAVEQFRLNGTWVDTKNGSILIRKTQGERPRVIRSTDDIIDLVGPTFKPNDFIFCAHGKFEVFDMSFSDSGPNQY